MVTIIPDLIEMGLPELSMIVSGSCRLSVEQRLSNSIRRASQPGKTNI